MTPEKLLFALLRLAVCGGEPDEETKSACTPDALKRVCALARRHDLAHLVGYAAGKAALPDGEAVSELRQTAALAVFRHARLDNELRHIEEALEQAGIDFLPLKGAVIRDLYPEPWMRTSGDIDVLVRKADLERAAALLAGRLSYRTDGERNYHDLLLVAPSGVHVELHFSIQENTAGIDTLLARVWDYARPAQGCRHELTDEFFVFHLIAHMSYHFAHGGCGIRPLLDVFLLLRQRAVDEGVLREYLRQGCVERFYDCVLELIGAWFENRPHTPVTEAMAEFILSGGTYGSRIQRQAVAQEREGGKVRYLLSRVFMPYSAMKQKYPILRSCPALLPFMQVRRWVELFFGGRLRRAAAELRRSVKIDREQSQRVSRLLGQLGL